MYRKQPSSANERQRRQRRQQKRSERHRNGRLVHALSGPGWCQRIAAENGCSTRLKAQCIKESWCGLTAAAIELGSSSTSLT